MHQRVDVHCRGIASPSHVLGAATMVSPLCVARAVAWALRFARGYFAGALLSCDVLPPGLHASSLLRRRYVAAAYCVA